MFLYDCANCCYPHCQTNSQIPQYSLKILSVRQSQQIATNAVCEAITRNNMHRLVADYLMHVRKKSSDKASQLWFLAKKGWSPSLVCSSQVDSPCQPSGNMCNSQRTPCSKHAEVYISEFCGGTQLSCAVVQTKLGKVCAVTRSSRFNSFINASCSAPLYALSKFVCVSL